MRDVGRVDDEGEGGAATFDGKRPKVKEETLEGLEARRARRRERNAERIGAGLGYGGRHVVEHRFRLRGYSACTPYLHHHVQPGASYVSLLILLSIMY